MPTVSTAISASSVSLEIYVDAVNGNDAAGNGSASNPFRTIGKGLLAGSSGMTVIVKPGVYSAAAGESFPLRLKEGLALVGLGPDGVTVDGAGANYVFEDAPQSRIELLTIRGGGRAGILLRSASTVAFCVLHFNFRGIVCESAAAVEDNLIENNSDTGVYISGSAAPSIRRNAVRFNGGEGLECLNSASPAIRENEIRENQKHGVVCTDDAAPLLQGNTITRNVLPEVYVLFGARPTLSGNVIRDNARYGIDDARSPNQGEISALGNTWNDPQPSGTIIGPADFRPNYFIKEAGNSIRFSG